MNQEINTSFLITKRFKSPTEFSLYIEERVLKEKIGCMDAIIDYCNTNDVGVDSICGLITSSLREKVENEAVEANMMKPRGKLPL